jgi:VanZ family protein
MDKPVTETVKKRWLVAWGPALAWAAFVFLLSSVPGTSLPSLPAPNFDKLVHGVVYFVLGALCLRGVGRTSALPAVPALLLAALLATLYGMSDEFHQSFTPDRSPDWHDVAADAVGGLAGALAATLLAMFTARRRQMS